MDNDLYLDVYDFLHETDIKLSEWKQKVGGLTDELERIGHKVEAQGLIDFHSAIIHAQTIIEIVQTRLTANRRTPNGGI